MRRGEGDGGERWRARVSREAAASGRGCSPASTGHCSVCGGESLECVVLEVLERGRTARVGSGGNELEVALDLLEDVGPGDRVVVHLGFALAVVREEGA